MKRDVAGVVADEDEASAVQDILRRGAHGSRRASSVNCQLSQQALGRLNDIFVAEPFGEEAPPRGAAFSNGNARARTTQAFEYGETYRTGADDQHALARLRAAAPHRMMADAEWFDGSELFERESGGGVELGGGESEAFAHATVDVNAESAEARAAVGASGEARVAGAAGEERVDAGDIAGRKAGAFGSGENFDGEFVAEDARIFDEHLAAVVGMEIAAADTDAEGAHQSVAGRWRGWFGNVDQANGLQCRELERLHLG